MRFLYFFSLPLDFRCAAILLAPVAVLMAARTAILATKREADINQYLTRTQSFNMKVLCKSITKMLHTTQAKHLNGKYCN